MLPTKMQSGSIFNVRRPTRVTPFSRFIQNRVTDVPDCVVCVCVVDINTHTTQPVNQTKLEQDSSQESRARIYTHVSIYPQKKKKNLLALDRYPLTTYPIGLWRRSIFGHKQLIVVAIVGSLCFFWTEHSYHTCRSLLFSMRRITNGQNREGIVAVIAVVHQINRIAKTTTSHNRIIRCKVSLQFPVESVWIPSIDLDVSKPRGSFRRCSHSHNRPIGRDGNDLSKGIRGPFAHNSLGSLDGPGIVRLIQL
mmetsp:Transcript_2302/g.3973  ORF Transcript_2302/g.3973 Transcript_2302/m.3973 type:complete len:251 (-) Transcript_2302:973-1725(-)